MKSKKKLILHLIISSIKAGKNPAKISKEHNIKKQTLQYYLRQLKKKGIIRKEGYGIWKVQKEVSTSPKGSIPHYKQIRGHAFIWKVKFNHKIDWIKRLKQNKVKYQLIGTNNSTPRLIINEKKVWLTNKGAVIYEPKSFLAASSHTSKGLAVYELDKTIKLLSKALKINLQPYSFDTSREHYGMIRNELARQYNDKGEKMIIRENKEGWLWIDFSHSIDELETNNPIISKQLQDYWNDAKANKFDVTMSDTKKMFYNLDNRIKQLEFPKEIKQGVDIPDYIN